MRIRRTTGLAAAAVFAAACLATGCGGSKNPIVPVEGKIGFDDGTPLPTGSRLVLNPSEGGTQSASGATDPSGGFKLKHATGTTGAEVGKYTVSLLPPEGDGGDFLKKVPKEYADGSSLVAEVKEGMAPLTLKVPRAKKK